MAPITQQSFSIHQELWHDCWLAATAAARSKRRQVDLNVQQRVVRLLEEYGPDGSMSLTLRVYGTMLKGFCIINNERVRGLHSDCERLVVAFSRRPFADNTMALKLAPAKRKLVDALTLDLDLAKVQEAEAMDWMPLEAGALLEVSSQLASQPLLQLEAGQQEQQSLLLRAALLDESFPAIDAPVTSPMDLSSAVVVPPPLPPPSAAAQDVDMYGAALGLAPQQDGASAQEQLQPTSAHQQQQRQGHELAAALTTALQAPKRRVVARRSEAGHIFGFDEDTMLPEAIREAWMADDFNISRPTRGPAYHVELVGQRALGRCGPLDVLLACHGAAERPALARAALGGDEAVRANVARGSVGPTEGVPVERECPGAAAWATVDEALGLAAGVVAEVCPPDTVLLESTRGANEELASVLAAPTLETSPQHKSRRRGGGAASSAYDAQTAGVGDVLRRCIAASRCEARSVTLDDVLPPAITDKATAARTFHALLALATGCEFHVEQRAPFWPITIDVM